MSGQEERMSPLPIAPAIRSDWSAERREQSLRAVHGRIARRARNVRVLAVSSLVAVLCLVVGFGVSTQLSQRYAVAERDGRLVRFGDGSSVQLLDQSSELDVGSASPSAVEVTLRSGSAEFDITPNPQRAFVVHAGVAEVRVLGTHFRVTREAPRVKVEVSRGRVEVRFAGGTRQLIAGESNWFPPLESASSEAPAAPAALSPAPSALPPVSSASPPASGTAESTSSRHRFLEHAAHGRYAAAYSVLERAPEVVGSSAEDLMLAADSARYSNHPLQATVFLERMTREHPQDSVAPLAAFTLGRIRLSQLGQPARAADAFALSRRLSPNGSLAEDALAREAEAAEKAGQRARASALVAEYARRYPSGHRLDALKSSLGLGDAP